MPLTHTADTAVKNATMNGAPWPLALASGGTIALVKDGDIIEIDIPNRGIKLAVPDNELPARVAPIESA